MHPKNKLERLRVARKHEHPIKRKTSWKRLTVDTLREWEMKNEIKSY